MNIVIVGGGEVGRTLSNILTKEGHKIVLIEKDRATANKIAEKTDALIVNGDGTEIQTMKDSKISEADAVVAATGDDKTNLMICEIAKSFNVKRLISRVNSVKNEELFVKTESMDIIPIVGLTVSYIKNILKEEGFRTISILASGDVEIIEVRVSPQSRLVMQPVSKIKKGVVSLIYRRNHAILPERDTLLLKNDLLVITTLTNDIPSVVKQFS